MGYIGFYISMIGLAAVGGAIETGDSLTGAVATTTVGAALMWLYREEEDMGKREAAEERRRQAEIILNVLAEDVINMNWIREEEYLRAIEKGLKRAEEERSHRDAD